MLWAVAAGLKGKDWRELTALYTLDTLATSADIPGSLSRDKNPQAGGLKSALYVCLLKDG